MQPLSLFAIFKESDVTPLLIALLTSGGIVGAVVAWVKLPTDKVTAAVTQAQGAASVLEATLQSVEDDRDYWRRRYEEEYARAEKLYGELATLRSALRLRGDDTS